ncbi:MAG: right-handed parallel beta-helix repeat-containing protein [Terriglobales bacterium]|jgi:hypothetical protein
MPCRGLRPLLLGLFLTGGHCSLIAATYAVGTCLPQYVSFSTIQSAVSSVPAGSMIKVCSGTYFEQVTITQPLTLEGVAVSNIERAVITMPPEGFLVNANLQTLGQLVAAGILVQNVSPPGPVNLSNLTVDGANVNLGCDPYHGIAGIVYATGASGTLQRLTTRNQTSSGCSFGIAAENPASSPTQLITIEHNSVHDEDGTGIFVGDTLYTTPSTTVTIIGNVVAAIPTPSGPIYYSGDIWVQDVNGTVAGNLITGGSFGIYGDAAGVSLSHNRLADFLPTGLATAISLTAGETAESNQISNSYMGIYGAANATITGNLIMNTAYAIVYNCLTNTVNGNTINDTQVAYYQPPSGVSAANTLTNVDTIVGGSCPAAPLKRPDFHFRRH